MNGPFGIGSGPAGFDVGLLADYYNAKLPPNAALVATRKASLAKAAVEKTLPPWDAKLPQPSDTARDRAALGPTPFFDKDAKRLSDISAAGDDNKLFALYQAVNRLAHLAAIAARDNVLAGQYPGLDRRFQSGTREIVDWLGRTSFENLTMLLGRKTAKVETSVAVPRAQSSYVGGIVMKGDVFAAVPGLAGNERLTITVRQNGADTPIAVDFSEIAGTLSLDAIAALVNEKLAAAGMFTRFRRTEIGETEPGDPKSFGLRIDGVSTEVLTLAADATKPALYVAGSGGNGTAEVGRLLKFSVDGTSVTGIFSKTIAPDSGTAVARAAVVDAEGNVYVVGDTTGSIGNQINQGTRDAVLQKYDSAGNLLWTRLLGAADGAQGLALALDPDGGVAIAGRVTGKLSPSAAGGGSDGFVARYSADGEETFLRQISPLVDDEIRAIAVGGDGAIYLGGRVNGVIAAGETPRGSWDSFVTKLDADGTLAWHRQFGSAAGDMAAHLALTSDGALVVAGVEDGQAVIRRYATANGSDPAEWEMVLGDLMGGSLGGIAVSGNQIYVSGSTANGALDASGTAAIANAHAGGADAFVFRIDDAVTSATANFVSYVGTSAAERAGGVTIGGGMIYLTGSTQGTFAGESQSLAGATNLFVGALDTSGVPQWTRQYGGAGGQSAGLAVAVDPNGAGVLDVLGLPRGRVTTGEARSLLAHSTVRAGDYFTIKLEGSTSREKRIVIAAGETIKSLASKINRVLLLDGRAEVVKTAGGNRLRIALNKDVKAELVPGKGDFDALKGLGLPPGLLVNDGSLLALTGEEDEEGKGSGPLIVGLDLDPTLKLTGRAEAERARELLLGVLAKIRKAYRELHPSPLIGSLKSPQKATGPAPAQIRSQIANYQAGLVRLVNGF